jgi:hypothetical protein
MQKYLYKLKLTLPTFVGISIFSIVFLVFFRWLLTIQFEILTIEEDVFLIWLPLIFPWIPILIWLRPKLRVLGFKKDNDRERALFQFIAWLTITASLITSQEYLSTSTGTLTELSQIKDFNIHPKSRYYAIKNLEIGKKYGGSYTDFRASGKHNERLNFDSYFVYPILDSKDQEVSKDHVFWFGVEFRKDISNRLSNEEKEMEYKAFLNESAKNFENYDLKKITYLVNIPFSIPQEERDKRVELTESLCVVDEEHFFHRGRMIIPINDYKEDLIWNVWTSISKENFIKRNDSWNDPDRVKEGPYFGWLQTTIPTYPAILNIKTMAYEQEVGYIPEIKSIEENHPLTFDQENGIALQKVLGIVDIILRGLHGKE